MNQSSVLNFFSAVEAERFGACIIYYFTALVSSGIFPCLWFNKKRAKCTVVNDISIKKEGCRRSGFTNLFWDFGLAK